jgi:hypothetical protein
VTVSVKEEMLPTADRPYPHTVDDVRTFQLVGRLTYEECMSLYPTLRSLPQSEARARLEEHVAAAP